MVQAAPAAHLALQSPPWPLHLLSSGYPTPGVQNGLLKPKRHHSSSEPKALVRPPQPPGTCIMWLQDLANLDPDFPPPSPDSSQNTLLLFVFCQVLA